MATKRDIAEAQDAVEDAAEALEAAAEALDDATVQAVTVDVGRGRDIVVKFLMAQGDASPLFDGCTTMEERADVRAYINSLAILV